MSIEHIHRQSLPFRLIDSIGLGSNADGKLAGRQPVGLQSFSCVAHQGEPATREELAYIIEAELWIRIAEKQRAAATRSCRILEPALSLPFGVEEMRKRGDGFRIYKLCIVSQ